MPKLIALALALVIAGSMIALAVTDSSSLSLATIQGLLAVGVTTVGVLLLHVLPRGRWLVATLLLGVVVPLAIGGFWLSRDQWGISDWDYYFSYHHTIRKILVTHHQFPFWNPYTCGGTAGLADPEFFVFTPTFLLEILFGTEVGFRLAIFLATLTGGWGMLALGKKLGLSVSAAFLAAFVYALGSVNLLEIVEGHQNIFAAGWVPWIFWAWLGAYHARVHARTSTKTLPQENFLSSLIARGAGLISVKHSQDVARRERKISLWPLVCGIFLALTFYQGGIYLLMYTSLAFILLPWLTRHPARAYLTTFYAGMWALGFAALKLIPVLLWLREFQDEMYAGSKFSLFYLPQILFGRYLHDAEVFPDQGSGWHEYGAYIGITTGVLALIGLVSGTRRSRVVRGLGIAAVLAVALSTSGPLLQPLFDHMSFFPRSNISRIILFVVIPLILLAGFGLDTLRRLGQRAASVTTLVLLGLTAAEIMTLSYALSLQAFVLPPVIPAVTPAPEPIAFTMHTYKTRVHGDDYTRAYAATLAGYGTLSYCSVLTPPPSVRTIHDEGTHDPVGFSAPGVVIRGMDWSPNSVTVSFFTPVATEVALNTNYAQGWLVSGVPARNIAGRVATQVEAGEHRLVFSYHPPGFLLGAIITCVALLLSLVATLRRGLVSPVKR